MNHTVVFGTILVVSFYHLLQTVLVVESYTQLTVLTGSRILSKSVRKLFPATGTSTAKIECDRNRNNAIHSSRQQYFEDSNNDADPDDASPRIKLSQMRREDIRLRRLANNEKENRRNESDEDDYYYGGEDDDDDDDDDGGDGGDGDGDDDDDDDIENWNNRAERQRNDRLATYSDYQYDDDDYFTNDKDDYYRNDEENTNEVGNFWSNPTRGVDRRKNRQQGRNYDDEDNYNEVRRAKRKRGRRTPIRDTTPQVPRVIRDFYDNIFWYGFDIDDIDGVGDKNSFGGTKGKFNGLDYLALASNNKKRSGRPKRSPRRLPPARSDKMTKSYDNGWRRPDLDIDDYYNDDDDVIDKEFDGLSVPTDDEINRYDAKESYSYNDDDYKFDNKQNRKPLKAKKILYDDDDDVDVDIDADEFAYSRSSGRRRRRQTNSDWSPINMIESFLGIDNKDMEYKANLYDSKMGLERIRSSSQRKRKRGRNRRQFDQEQRLARDFPERPGYAYKYDTTEDDDQSTPILDIDGSDILDDSSVQSKPGRLSDASVEINKKERSWEERQMAMERVPPADVVAWGPSGELSMTARMKAFLDAQEDTQIARRKLKALIGKESEIQEEISILKVDAERKQLKLDEYPSNRSRRDVEELRQIELEIDDAYRSLRRTRARVARAREYLEEIEERHYAVMGCYNVEQASNMISEDLNEISKSVQIPITSVNRVDATAQME